MKKSLKDYSKEEILMAEQKTRACSFLPSYHIYPKSGLLNDPNGLCFYNGLHYWSFQYHPVEPVHGIKYWYNLTTKDFLNYEDNGIQMFPDKNFDKDGVYSGSAYIDDDKLKYLYTANSLDENFVRTSTQIIAELGEDKKISKKILIEHDKNIFGEHFRDPMIFEYENSKYIVIGSQLKEKNRGAISIFDFNGKTATLKTNIAFEELHKDNFMIECPIIKQMNEGNLLIINPMYKNDFKSFSNCNFVVFEKIDFENQKIIMKNKFDKLDHGYDFYAPQIYDFNNKTILIAWMGATNKQNYPSDSCQWQGMLTLPREISLQKNFLIQKPLEEFKKSITAEKIVLTSSEFKIHKNSFIIDFEIEDSLVINFKADEQEELILSIFNDEIVLDISKAYKNFDIVNKKIKVKRKYNKQKIEIFVDSSSIEIFCNNYEDTITSRFFIKKLNKIIFSKELNFNYKKTRRIKLYE